MGMLALTSILARECRLPVVAAGGIMDGAGIAAALQLGACAAQMGTAFILCPESAASAAYRAELQSDHAHHTAITAAISGRPARGMFNRLHQLGRDYAGALPAYPMVYDAGRRCTRRPVRKVAATTPRIGPVKARRWRGPCQRPT